MLIKPCPYPISSSGPPRLPQRQRPSRRRAHNPDNLARCLGDHIQCPQYAARSQWIPRSARTVVDGDGVRTSRKTFQFHLIHIASEQALPSRLLTRNWKTIHNRVTINTKNTPTHDSKNQIRPEAPVRGGALESRQQNPARDTPAS